MVKNFLKNLKWKPTWVTHLGCLKSCAEYLGLKISDGWLFGGTGHAFILNIHKVVCPSSPTAWKSSVIFKLSRNLGIIVKGVYSYKTRENFREKQKEAFKLVRESIDKGLPCYGWELDIPEYYVIYGYDDTGYYYTGVSKGHKNWWELGLSEIGVLEVHCVKLGSPANDLKIIKDALLFAIEFTKPNSKWIYKDYYSGLKGYEVWIKALKEGKYDKWGAAYNAAVWCECREKAVEFLREARERLSESINVLELFREAEKYYRIVAENLKQVSKIFPFPPRKSIEKNEILKAVKYLEKARDSEGEALKILEEILEYL